MSLIVGMISFIILGTLIGLGPFLLLRGIISDIPFLRVYCVSLAAFFIYILW